MLSCATAVGDPGLARGMQGMWEPGPRLRCTEDSSRAGAQALGQAIGLSAANRSPRVRRAWQAQRLSMASTAGS